MKNAINVNLNTIISYVKNGEKHHFMDDYEKRCTGKSLLAKKIYEFSK